MAARCNCPILIAAESGLRLGYGRNRPVTGWSLCSAAMLNLVIAVVAISCALATTACGSTNSAGSGTGSSNTLAIQFADCMRSHGVPDFPDPGHGSGNRFQDNPQSAAFKSASTTCDKLQPGGCTATEAVRESPARDAQIRPVHAQARHIELPRPDAVAPTGQRPRHRLSRHLFRAPARTRLPVAGRQAGTDRVRDRARPRVVAAWPGSASPVPPSGHPARQRRSAAVGGRQAPRLCQAGIWCGAVTTSPWLLKASRSSAPRASRSS
jgi:hypothetical protein